MTTENAEVTVEQPSPQTPAPVPEPTVKQPVKYGELTIGKHNKSYSEVG